MSELLTALETVIDIGQAQGIGRTFEWIEIAEQEIERAIVHNPEQGEAIWHLFMAMNSPHIPMHMTVAFRINCRQLIQNVLSGVEIDCPTMVETAIMVVGASTYTAPPRLDISQPILAHEETMTAFGLKPLRSDLKIDSGDWVELTRVNREFYRRTVGQTRGEIYKESCKKNNWPAARKRILGEEE